MPGKKDDHLRRGNLAEELGVYLLKRCAAVAHVPQTDDVGIDAVATLFRRHCSRKLLAEQAFYVQFKAASVRTIDYRDEVEVRWLKELQLPFFVGSVSVEDASMSLYTGHNLSRVFLEHAKEEDYDAISLRLDSEGAARARKHGSTNDPRVVSLGPPVFVWDCREVADPGFVDKANAVLGPWIACESRNIKLREIRYFENMKWETNEPAMPTGAMMMGSSDPSKGLVHDLEAMKPYVDKLIMHIHSAGSTEDIAAVALLVALMRRYGVEPEANSVFEVLAKLRLEELAKVKPDG